MELRASREWNLRDWLYEVSPTFNWDWPYLAYTTQKLEDLYHGVIKRLIIEMPPRHGKSTLASVRFPAYVLERDPTMRIMLGSYSQTLAEKFSRQCRRIVAERIGVDRERRSVSDWLTGKGEGGMRAVGVGGGATGMGANLGIIDDPIKSRAEADSEVYRDKVWEWFTDDFYSRLEPNARLIVIQCMTGDTPVLMADGTQIALREIKIGDRVATYDKGKLKTSKVLNHKSNGRDSVFKITMMSGKIVRANERHPFLVEDNGKLKWIRLKNLTTAHKIVTLKDNGINGKEKNVLLNHAKKRFQQEGIVRRTTIKKDGQTGIGQLQSIKYRGGVPTLSTDMELQNQITMQCTQRKMVDALFASNCPEKTYERIGMESYALTIAMKKTKSDLYYATTATLPLVIPKQRQPRLQLQNTSDFIADLIKSIEPAGIEEVFDVQIEGTENFIANGLVSHNTRWHEDDLIGRILASDDAGSWERIRFPALAEPNDLLHRAEGEALCPERYDIDALLKIQQVMKHSFQSLYQQRPSAVEGEIFKRDYWKYYRQQPNFKMKVMSIDSAFKTKAQNDFSVIGVFGKTDTKTCMIDRWKAKVEFPDLKRAVVEMANRHSPNEILIEDKASGQSLIQELKRGTNLPIIPVAVDSDKISRANASVGYIEAGKLELPESAPWLLDYIDTMASFPNGAHDDDVDVTTQYLSRHGFKPTKEFYFA